MLDVTKRPRHEAALRTIIFLEFLAASAILGVVAVVLYMVLTYHPA